MRIVSLFLLGILWGCPSSEDPTFHCDEVTTAVLTATIDGEPFAACDVETVRYDLSEDFPPALYFFGNEHHRVDQKEPPGLRRLNFLINSPLPGSHDLLGANGYIVFDNGEPPSEGGRIIESTDGALVVTSSANGVLAGTFFFEASDDDGLEASVSDGVFSFEFDEEAFEE